MIQFRSGGTQVGARLKRLLLCGAGWLAAALVQPAFGGVNTPTRVGPYGGGVQKVAFHPTDSSIVYATARSGFYRSTDGGQTWQVINDRIPNGGGDIAVHPTQPNRVFVVSAMPGVLASTDAGQTLSVLASSTGFHPTGNDVEYSADGSMLYVSNIQQVYRSADQGATWTAGGQIPTAPFFSRRLVVDPTDPNRLYVTGDTGQAFQSSNAGVTWQPWSVPNTLINDLAIANTQPSPRIWAATTSGLRYTDDRGASWTFASTIPTQTVTVDPVDPTIVYAGTFNDGLFRTDGNSSDDIQGDVYMGIIRSIAIDPASPNRLLVTGGPGILRTDNGGTQWSLSHSGIDAVASYELVSSPATDKIYIVASGDGIYALSPEDGSSTPVNNTQLRQIAGVYGFQGMGLMVRPGAPDQLFMASSGDVLRSLDGGDSWSRHSVSTQEGFYRIVNASLDGSRLLATTGRRVYVSTDSGITWAEGPALTAGDLHVMASAPSNPQRVYMSGRLPGAPRDILLSSTDGGATWNTHAFPGVDILNISVDPSNDQTLYTTGGLSELFKSTNGGQTWTSLTIAGEYTRFGGPFWSFAIDPQNPNILYAGGGSFIARSVDAGATWQQLWYDTERFLDTRSLLVDPLRPHNLYVALPGHGVREISIQPDLRILSTSDDIPNWFGSATSYSYRVSNAGPFDATNVRARIQLPPGVTNVLAESTSASCTAAGTIVTCVMPILRTNANVDITVTATHPTSGDFSMTASVEGDQPDAASTDNTVTSDVTVTEVSDLSVIMTGSAIIARNEAASLSLTVTNAGPNTSSVASVTLQLGTGMNIASVTPAGGGVSTCVTAGNTASCQLPQLAVGASVILNIASTANSTAGSFTHLATVDASGTDLRGSNNVATAVTTVSDMPQGISGGGKGGGGGGGTSPFLLAALLLLAGVRVVTNKFPRAARQPLS